MALTGLTTPAPEGTTQVTVRPPTPLPLSSVSRTTSESGSWKPAGAVWSLPETRTSAVGIEASAVWVNVTGEPSSPSTAACAV